MGVEPDGVSEAFGDATPQFWSSRDQSARWRSWAMCRAERPAPPGCCSSHVPEAEGRDAGADYSCEARVSLEVESSIVSIVICRGRCGRRLCRRSRPER
jgi:hypothetical protein